MRGAQQAEVHEKIFEQEGEHAIESVYAMSKYFPEKMRKMLPKLWSSTAYSDRVSLNNIRNSRTDRSLLFDRLFYFFQICCGGRALRDEYGDLVLVSKSKILCNKSNIISNTISHHYVNLASRRSRFSQHLRSRLILFCFDSICNFSVDENMSLVIFMPRTMLELLRDKLNLKHVIMTEPTLPTGRSYGVGSGDSVGKFIKLVAQLCSELVQYNFLT